MSRNSVTRGWMIKQWIRTAVEDAGGTDLEIKENIRDNDIDNRTYEVTFSVGDGIFYQTWCKVGNYGDQLYWAHSPRALAAGLYPELAFRYVGEAEPESSVTLSDSRTELLRNPNATKERLLHSLHSTFRYERIKAIELTLELGIQEGVVIERIRDMAHVDPVKDVRLKAAACIVRVEGNLA